ncbi:Leucine-rich repeat-containing protein 37A2 [Heterocephalus glaber]|uniref:Leucine-rich repeat-containing protein 37A2 n=1 Tax=Heterocephalus glaber TaxID=10181 RepID=G5BMS1_HETGA|nr:Leucine-rich repeat-containing protein 37A2 [Heterocephalus glaber]
MHQDANAPSGSRSEAHHSNMAFVTVRPVDMKLTTSAEAGKKPQPTSSHLQILTEAPESPEEEEPSSTQQEVLAQTSELSEEMEISSTHQEAPAQPLGPLAEAELSATKTKPAQPSESSRTEEPSEIQLKAPDQPSDLETEELETSPTQLKQPAQFSDYERVTFSAQPSEPPEDTEPFSVPQEEDAAPLSEPPNEMETSQAQQMTPPQPTEEEEPSPAPPPAASPPPDPPEEVELSPTQPMMRPQLPSEPPSESTAHPPPRSEMTVPTPAQGQAQQPSVALHPLDLEVTIIPERTTDGEFSTALKKALPLEALPPKHHEVTLPPPDWVQTQHSKLSLLTVQPLHRKLTSAPGISAKVRSFPTMPETPSQPPEPPKVVQTLAPHEVKVVTPEQPEVMLTHPEQVQAQYPNLAEVTVPPLDVQFVVTEYSVSHSPGKASTVQEKQNARTNTDICELCTCQNETLSCNGLSPNHKLHQVPVLEPNNTFTTFNFQEKAIFHLGENSWTTYRWAEKLNLSENGLTGLHKNSFKGLLSLHYLDLSCNKIQFIEAQTFEALPFLQVLKLRCNLVTQISFGKFRVWHGMQFLHRVILNHNPLSSVEDSYPFKLPALRYLDLETTHTPLPAVENILMMTLELKTLIILRHMACCLCQFKRDIEVVCKTVKLHCDSECVTSPTQCLEEAPVGNPEGAFMKVLQAQKKNTKTELVIESGKSSSEQSDVSWSDFMDEELDSNDENDVAGALSHILPYFSEVNLEGLDSLLPPIQLLFSTIQNEDNPQGYMKGNMKNPSHQPVSSSLAYRNELKKLYFLQSWLDAEIQGKLGEVKKKEKTGMLTQSSLSSPKFQIIPDIPEKLASAQAQENWLVEDQHEGRRQQTVDRVLKGLKGIQKRLLERGRNRRTILSLNYMILIGSAAVEVGRKAAGNTPEKNVFTTNSPISATDSALTLISTDDHTNERHSEYTSTSTEPPPPETSVPLLSYPGDEFETQLNQQLHILIPNKEVRGLISYIITSLKKDCSETRMHLACAKLISRTGRLMKLLSKQQEEKVAQAQWDTEQWKSETYINKSSGVSSNQKAQGEPRDHTQEVPGHSYNKKLILAISVTVTPVLLIIILCLIEICSHRTASGKDEEGSSSSICGLRRKYSVEKDSQEGFSSFSQPLWRWYLRRPLSLSQQHSMAKKLHHKDSSSKDERVIWEASEISSE